LPLDNPPPPLKFSCAPSNVNSTQRHYFVLQRLCNALCDIAAVSGP
jgi:hypothetical protein